MPVIHSSSLKDSPHLQVVSVIASFDTDGKVKPLYVRIGQESYKVHSSWAKPGVSNLIKYQCQIIDGNNLKPLQLTYHSVESLCVIPKPESR